MATKSRIFRVSEITQDIKIILENTYTEVWVEGEISNLSQPASGHIYFTLKDDSAQLKCVSFRGVNQKIRFKIEDGLAVVVSGKISVYEKGGQYQLYVNTVEPKGLGALQLAFEQLKERLEKEGLFDKAHKRELPFLPLSIGLVTSPTGAAIKDMINILRRRAPFAKIIIRSVRVQGEGAAEEIAQAIKEFNEFAGVDVLIVGRGGGSLEDLWSFNEEVVARSIYNSKIPVISAVGHQIDFTISDFVADVRAGTPSEAAEIVASKKEDLVKDICALLNRAANIVENAIIQNKQDADVLWQRAAFALQTTFRNSNERCVNLAGKLKMLSPLNLIAQEKRTLVHLEERLKQKIHFYLSFNQQRFNVFSQKLEALSPLKILARGYSISFVLPQGEILKDAAQIKKDTLIKTRISNGSFISQVKEVN